MKKNILILNVFLILLLIANLPKSGNQSKNIDTKQVTLETEEKEQLYTQEQDEIEESKIPNDN